jgi:branched-chain amino acid transport system permease protein
VRAMGHLWKWGLAIGIAWVLDLVLGQSLNPYYIKVLLTAGIYIVLSVSLNLVNGFTGQFSMGHAGFMAVGGYAAAFLTTTLKVTAPELFSTLAMEQLLFFASLLVGGLLAAGAGVLVGMPSLRLRGDYLAIVTLGFGEIIRVLILNLDFLGGARGMPGIPMYSNFGWVYTWVILTIFVMERIVRSSKGRGVLAVREDEIAAEAMGVPTTRVKVQAFSIGAFFAGIGGGLYGHHVGILDPGAFDFNKSFEFIIMVVLGGMGSITGSVVAAFLLILMREGLRELQSITQVDLRMIIYSLLLIVLMLTRPRGLFGTREIRDFFPRFRKGASA